MALSDDSSFDATPITKAMPTASRRSPLAYYTSAAKRSFRDAFGRQQLIDALKAFLWVAPLTILIWIYAEREQLSTQKNFPIPVEIRSADPRQVITVTRPSDQSITAELVGPRAQLDRVREEFSRRSDAKARIEIGKVDTLGPRQVSAEAVGDDSLFAGNGVMLNNLNPRVLDVYVDVLDDVDLPVKLPPTVTNVTNPVFTPATVRLTAPRAAIENAPKPLAAYVDAASIDQLKPGATSAKGLQLTSPLKDKNARLATMTVDATFEVKQADVEYVIQSIPVWKTTAPNVDAKYKVEYEATTLPTVTVIGPRDRIEEIKKGTAVPMPMASFKVSQEHFVAGTAKQQAPVHYDLPPGVRVKPEDATRTIEFQLVERDPE